MTLLTNVHLVKAMVFPVVTYGCESWTIQNLSTEEWCFWFVVLEKTLESPLDCEEIQPVYSKGNQSWIFIGRTDAEAETPVLWLPDAKSWLIWKKTLVLGKIKVQRWKARQRMRCLDGIPDSVVMNWVNSGSWWLTGRPGVLQSMGSQSIRHDWATELNWTELISMYNIYCIVDDSISLG